MKKLSVLLLMTIAVTMTACGTQKSLGTKTDADVVSMEKGDGEAAQGMKLTYGKVTSIVGNEIEVMLGKLPEAEETEAVSVGNGVAVAAAPAVQGGDVPEMELEYTGEKEKFTVNSGVPVMNNGQESNVSAIKEGTVIGIMMEETDDEALKLKEIQIIG